MDVIVESNCRVLVNLLNSHSNLFRFRFRFILEDAVLLMEKFSSSSIIFIFRLCNDASHVVTCHGLSFVSHVSWLVPSMEWLCNVLKINFLCSMSIEFFLHHHNKVINQ